MSKPKDLPKTDLHESMTRNIENYGSSNIQEEFRIIGMLNSTKAQREIESHEALLQIVDNTQGIRDLVSLVREGNRINQQTFPIDSATTNNYDCSNSRRRRNNYS